MSFIIIGSALKHFNHGVVLTSQPLQVDELFEVRLDSKVPKWNGSLYIGATTVSPEDMEFPWTITSMEEGTTFVLSSDKIALNGRVMTTISEDLDSLSVCCTRKKTFLTQNCTKRMFDNNVVSSLSLYSEESVTLFSANWIIQVLNQN